MEHEVREFMTALPSIHESVSFQFIKHEVRELLPSKMSNLRSMLMKENLLIDISKQFAIKIVNLCTDIKENRKSNVLVNQILRSGTSIGANIHEANYASSKADFIYKLQIALKECYETDYWLSLFKDTHIITDIEYKDLYAICSKIRKMLTASITTAKN